MIDWSDDQKQVITFKGYPLLVSAAAGSGKTAVLVERIIRMITDKDNPIDVDRLLVVTFTNAAASEMKARISKRLSESLEENPSDENLHRQMALINRSNISTIHSFCLKVIDENFYEANIDPGYRIADDNEIRMIKDEAMAKTLEEFYDLEDDSFNKLSDIFGGNKGDVRLEEVIMELHSFSRSGIDPENWITNSIRKYSSNEEEFIRNFIPFIKKEVGDVLKEAITLNTAALDIISNNQDIAKLEETFKQDKVNLEYALQRIEEIVDFDELSRTIDLIEFVRLATIRKGQDVQKNEEILKAKNIINSIRGDYKKQVAKIKEQFFFENKENNLKMLEEMNGPLSSLCKVTNSYGKNFKELKRERNVVDFNDLEHFALKILVDVEYSSEGEIIVKRKDIAKEYAKYFEEILIDEYQDSNDVQEAILNAVSKDGNNVFMVGDVKQSIYKFRQAKPALFMKKYDEFTIPKDVNEGQSNGRKILLNANFRSRKEVLESVNEIFRGVMQKESGELEYGENESLKYASLTYKDALESNDKSLNPHFVELDLIDSVDEESVEKADESSDVEEESLIDELSELKGIELEAIYVANKIKNLVEKEEITIYDSKTNEKRPISYSDIVILLRAVGNAAPIFVKELNNLAIPAYSDSATGYFDSLEIRTMMAFLMSIDNKRQDIPLLATMRSPIFNFTEEDFIDIRSVSKDKLIIDCIQSLIEDEEFNNEDLKKKCINLVNTLDLYRKKSIHMNLDEFIWMIMEDTAYFEYAGAMPNGIQRQANLKLLFQKATDFEKTSYKGLFNFITYMKTIKEKEGDFSDAKILGENEDVVRVMSIHKSKGLEFPVVFISNVGKKFNRQDQYAQMLMHEEEGIGTDWYNIEKSMKNKTLPKVLLSRKINQENLAEEMRVLYVAMTRAKEKLFITSSIKDAKKALLNWASEYSFDKFGRLTPVKTLKANSYLDWIMPIVLKKSLSDYQKNIINEEVYGFFKGNKGFDINVISKKDLVLNVKEEQKERDSSFYNNEELKNERLRQILNYRYPYSEATKSPSKISVSVIKKRVIEENEEASNMVDFDKDILNVDGDNEIKKVRNINSKGANREIPKPIFLKEDTKLAASEKGTAFHTVMYHINPMVETIDEIEAEIQRLVDMEIMLKVEAESVDPQKILTFLNSNLGKRFKEAYLDNRLYREEMFYRSISIKDAFESAKKKILDSMDDKLTIIGIIDAFFINEEGDGLVLLDYKTDSLKNITEEDLVKRYYAQIVLYKEALEAITGREVKQMFLYSTFKDTEVEVLPNK